MNEEEIETLCNTGELEIVRPSVVFQHSTKNKCGNITRDGVAYPDMIEVLLMDEVKRYHWGRDVEHSMLHNFFPGLNDIFVLLSHTRGRHVNGNYVDHTEGFGMYFSRNNYTIDEDENYYYVTTNYDLYVHSKIVDPRVPYNDDTLMLRAIEPTSELDDTVGRRILNRSVAHRGDDNRGRHRRNYYYMSEHPEIRRHVVENILPGLTEHACDTERSGVQHVPNALTVCNAIEKRLTIHDLLADFTDSETTRQYSWLEMSAAQTSLRNLCTNMSAYTEEDFSTARSSDLDYNARKAFNAVEVATDGSHHKKNEIMFMTIANRTLRPAISGVWYAQVISTSESPGDLQSMLSRKLGARNLETDLTRKVLMSERAAISSYPDEEVKIALGRLTPSPLTLVRVGDATKSPRGSTLMDICRFGDGVYEAIVDRPMELVKGEAKIKLEPGTYVICVEDIDDADFLWYTRLAAEDFSSIEIREIHSRLNLVNESDRQFSSSSNASDRRLTFNQNTSGTVRSSGRFGRRQISFDNLNEE